MDAWTLHWLEASGDLAALRPELIGEFQMAYRAISTLMPPPRLDVLVQRIPGETIPEIGMVGRTYRNTLFAVTVDPENSNFMKCLQDGGLHRTVIHEVHHCLRMAGPGYGWTLGEALVSEGLAGQFVRSLVGNEPEPWERALTAEELRANPVDMKTLSLMRYDHRAWFFGSGPYPRWLGYTLGYRMVGHWLEEAGDVDASTWINVPAKTVLDAAISTGFVSRES